MNYVIFKELDTYKMTSESNYNALIRNASQVTVFRDCNSFDECVACLPKYEGINFIDKTGDKPC